MRKTIITASIALAMAGSYRQSNVYLQPKFDNRVLDGQINSVEFNQLTKQWSTDTENFSIYMPAGRTTRSNSVPYSAWPTTLSGHGQKLNH